MKQPISLVIFDLDNTLWDWVQIWYASFSAMLNRLAADSGVPMEDLKEEFHFIHKQHGTAEYAFSIEERPSLCAKHPGQDLRRLYAGAIEDFRAARAAHLKTYPGVRDALEMFKHKGCVLVG
jgi:phosphoglycolate phosphatase